MDYTIVLPTFDEATGEVHFPTRQNYLEGLRQVITDSKPNRYFGIYYSGMTFAESGDWAVLHDSDPA